MSKIRNGVALAVLCVLAFACGTLDKTGVYQGDKFLYDADLAITTSADVIKGFVTWEKQNAKALTSIPEIHQAAERMRKDARKWNNTALVLRDAYAINPTPQVKADLQKALDVLHSAVSEATKYLVEATATK